MKTLLTGSIAFDVLYRYTGSFIDGLDPSSLDHLSVSYRMDGYRKSPGGNGLFIACALKLLGEEPLLYGTVGADGRELIEMLERRGIDVSGIETTDHSPTARAIVGTDRDGRQITFYHPGADAERQWREPEGEVSVAVVGPSQAPLTMAMLEWCEKRNITCILDPGQQTFALRDDELWKAMNLCHGLMVNTYEWEMIARRLQVTPQHLLEESILEEDFAPALGFVLVTNDEAGFTLFEPGSAKTYPSCKAARVVNATCAGDVFRAGFLYGMRKQWPLVDCGKLGAAIAAAAVESEDILETIDWDDVRKRVREAYQTELPA